jgi:eukaryotic-like serine/threonine-protein kinase
MTTTDRIGQLLGNYRLTRLLGQGGFADVYLAEHVHLKTQAAIKVLHTQLTSEYVLHFRGEARTIAHLEHPHIVKILDFGVEETIPYFVMVYAPNGTLRQRYPRGIPLPAERIVGYVKQVASALQYAHSQKIIHRDVKPENLLLGRKDEVLLSDFGIALLTPSTRTQSLFGQNGPSEMAGTLPYMAPEQLQGKPLPASDQYALGVMVYEWLCGMPPFTGSYMEIALQHVSALPPLLQEKDPTIPADVERVVLTALAKDPQLRFASVQAFATALEQAASGALHVPVAWQVLPTQLASDVHLPQEHSVYQAPPLALRGGVAQSAYGQQGLSGPAPAPSGGQGPLTASAPLPSVSEYSPQGLTPVVPPVLPPDLQHVPAGQPPFQPAPIQSAPKAAQPPRHFSRWLIIANVAVLLLLLGGGILAYATIYQPYVQNLQQQRATLQHQLAVQQHQLAVALEDPYTHQGKLVLSDPLENNSKGYGWSEDAPNCVFINGTYHAIAPDARYPDYCLARTTNFSDFVFEAQMQIIKGDAGGLVFRVTTLSNGNDLYAFYIGQDRSYYLNLEKVTDYPILTQGFSSAIHQGLNQNNLIAVVAQGSSIMLYVNHQFLTKVTNSTFTSGQLGVLVVPSSQPTEVIFSNVNVWQLP